MLNFRTSKKSKLFKRDIDFQKINNQIDRKIIVKQLNLRNLK
jgi:hypothetical protein